MEIRTKPGLLSRARKMEPWDSSKVSFLFGFWEVEASSSGQWASSARRAAITMKSGNKAPMLVKDRYL